MFQKKTDQLVNRLVLDQMVIIQNQAKWAFNLGKFIYQGGEKRFNIWQG
jgi:hypothetical protein